MKLKTNFRKILILESLVFLITISVYALKPKAPVYKTIFASQDASLAESIERGKEIYNDFCMQCHLPDGKGTKDLIPPLAGSNWLKEKREESIHSVKYGLQGKITVNGKIYNSAMTAMGLEDEEIADVMNYIMNSWGNTQNKIVTPEEVAAINK